MPFKSKSQWRWCFANGHDWCEEWAHETPGGYKSLPESKQSGYGFSELDPIDEMCDEDPDFTLNEAKKETRYMVEHYVKDKELDGDVYGNPLYYFFLSASYYQMVLSLQNYLSRSKCKDTFDSRLYTYKRYKDKMVGLLPQMDYVNVVVKDKLGFKFPTIAATFLKMIRKINNKDLDRQNYTEFASHLSSLPKGKEFREQMILYWLMKFAELRALPSKYMDSVGYWIDVNMKRAKKLDRDDLHLTMNDYLIRTKTSDKYSTDKAYSRYENNVPFEQLEYDGYTYTFTYVE